MTTDQNQFTLEVWGDLACFTRPETKVERFSYPVITPSAARGVFDAVFCNKHKMWWQIKRVELLTEPKFIALRRNEVKGRAPADQTIKKWMNGNIDPQPLLADGDDEATGRTQRQTIALKDVRYRITAELMVWPGFESQRTEFRDKFVRKARSGQCLYQPYLGCREFVAYFQLVGEEQVNPVPVNFEIGWMIYDVFALDAPGTSNSRPAVSIFRASVVNGVLEIPAYSSDAVKKPEVHRA
ncbi:type I-C CRISPR-associated protein Cas5c [Kamptonema cortianum]|nr:type I-C CRISPR-associated protein Cas5c [Kamptonema cortianum]